MSFLIWIIPKIRDLKPGLSSSTPRCGTRTRQKWHGITTSAGESEAAPRSWASYSTWQTRKSAILRITVDSVENKLFGTRKTDPTYERQRIRRTFHRAILTRLRPGNARNHKLFCAISAPETSTSATTTYETGRSLG